MLVESPKISCKKCDELKIVSVLRSLLQRLISQWTFCTPDIAQCIPGGMISYLMSCFDARKAHLQQQFLERNEYMGSAISFP